MKKQTISVVLATFNEESNIDACLNSVKDWADEIIVVDEESTDKTREIAKGLGAKVFEEKHEPIFHVTKNKAIKRAKSDWILQLDADEVIPSELRQEIQDLLIGKSFGYDSWLSPVKKMLGYPQPKKLSKPATAYWLTRKNLFLGRYLKNAGQYPDPIIRLFQRGKAFLPAKDVHEQMMVDGNIGWLKNDYLHNGTPDFKRYLLREDRYSSLHAVELKNQKVKITIFNTLNYLFIKPASTFFSLYLRHRGILDGFPGFIFSLYSGLHHAFSYMKLWELYKRDDFAS